MDEGDVARVAQEPRSGAVRKVPDPEPRADEAGTNRSVVLLSFAIEYGPFIAAGVLLVLASLASEIPAIERMFPNSRVGIYVVVAFTALLAFIVRAANQQAALRGTVRDVVASTDEMLEYLQPAVEVVSLSHAFRLAEEVVASTSRIRIFAITSRFISQQMRSDAFRSSRVDLMIGGSAAAGGPSTVTEWLDVEVRLAVEYSWASRVRTGQIGVLHVRQYTFHPTEWYVVFDDRLLVQGGYVYDERAVGCTGTPDRALVVRPTGAGRQMIDEKTRGFDALFSANGDRIGNGPLDGEYQLKEQVVMRRIDGEDWCELPPISQAAALKAPAAPVIQDLVEEEPGK